jgi:hypothetical protein
MGAGGAGCAGVAGGAASGADIWQLAIISNRAMRMAVERTGGARGL